MNERPSDCPVCRANEGIDRISPGAVIYEGRAWQVEHAYPTSLLDWLVIVLRRHVEARVAPIRTGLRSITHVCLTFAVACSGATSPREDTAPLTVEEQIQLPDGFRIAVWADRITRPRSLALGEQGTVFVGTYFFTPGVTSPIYALRDTDGDYFQDRIWTLSNGFGTPNGIDYHDGTLFVVDEHRVLRADAIEESLESPNWVTIYSQLPTRAHTELATDRGHWWRYLRYGPDDRLYISVGTRWSFLVGEHTARDVDDPPVYSTIVRMNPDGSGFEIFADGVRNSMGMDFHPTSGALWFTDNGPSWPFDDPRFYDVPPDELNRVSTMGEHFGFPYVHGQLLDPLIGGDAPTGHRAPAFEFEAHSAPLGARFYTGTSFPARYHGALFIAEHGTEATTPALPEQVDGDRISVVFTDQAGRVTGYEVFADNFMLGSNATYNRRPVDLLVLPDGSLLVSDDQSQQIYRIWYEG